MKLFLNPRQGFSPRELQSRLLTLAAVFLFLFSVVLTLSPAVQARSWQVDFLWSHWVGYFVWVVVFSLIHWQIQQHKPEADHFLLPLTGILSGWGLLAIYTISIDFGLRQTLWLGIVGAIFILGLRLPSDLAYLRRYKYLLLGSGLAITALTLIFGSNPENAGPRLWLGLFGFYFQPSEPLKLLLIIYLAAYLADKIPLRSRFFPLIVPTLLVTGLALLLLFAQRDLGTASLFILLFTTILYLASGYLRVLLAGAAFLTTGGLAGYFTFDVVQLRIEAWINPWLDPSGRSYQIVQSIIAIANGGMLGRGPGIGYPQLVPIAHSDFIFTTIAEETGLIGTVGLLTVLGLFLARGMQIAIRATNHFHRLLAAGLTAFIGIQSILIIGGNLRLLPLTGITLPLVSYGGSSLLTTFLLVLLLLHISVRSDEEPAPLFNAKPYLLVTMLLGLGIFSLALLNGWWSVARNADLLTRTDNARRSIADQYVLRGSLLDRRNQQLVITTGETGFYQRKYLVPALSPVIGYTHPAFGQAGVEAGFDPYLRGLRGNPASLIAWNELLYGQPPAGLNVRLSLDLAAQQRADELLGTHTGAVVLINAENGEILVMASRPGYDANLLQQIASELIAAPDAPLLNRVTQGLYRAEGILYPFIDAAFADSLPDNQDLIRLYNDLGFYTAPQLSIVTAIPASYGRIEPLNISPLQLALAASALSNNGVIPAPTIVNAVLTPHQGWVILPPQGESRTIFTEVELVHQTAQALMVSGQPFWQHSQKAQTNDVTWFMSGTLPGWQGAPLVVVVVLEDDLHNWAAYIGQQTLLAAVSP